VGSLVLRACATLRLMHENVSAANRLQEFSRSFSIACGSDSDTYEIEVALVLQPLFPKPPFPLLIRAHRTQEVDLAKSRPGDIAEVEFAVGALP
jgi:hypothetical protein